MVDIGSLLCRVWNTLRCVVLKVLPFSQMRLLIDSHFYNTWEMELRPNAASGILAIWTNIVCAVRLNSENMFSAGHFHLFDLVFVLLQFRGSG